MINQGSSVDRALYHDDMNAVRELLEEIERRYRKPEYILALMTEIGSTAEHETLDRWEVPFNDFWLFVAATPKQHAHAFIAATQAP